MISNAVSQTNKNQTAACLALVCLYLLLQHTFLLYLFNQGPIHTYTGVLCCFSARHTSTSHKCCQQHAKDNSLKVVQSARWSGPGFGGGSVRVLSLCVECSSNIPGVLSPLFIYTDCQHAKRLDCKVIKSYIGNIRLCRKTLHGTQSVIKVPL